MLPNFLKHCPGSLDCSELGLKGRETGRYQIRVDKYWATSFIWQKLPRKCCFTCTIWTSNDNDLLLLQMQWTRDNLKLPQEYYFTTDVTTCLERRTTCGSAKEK
jgi:hypothetical protein